MRKLFQFSIREFILAGSTVAMGAAFVVEHQRLGAATEALQEANVNGERALVDWMGAQVRLDQLGEWLRKRGFGMVQLIGGNRSEVRVYITDVEPSPDQKQSAIAAVPERLKVDFKQRFKESNMSVNLMEDGFLVYADKPVILSPDFQVVEVIGERSNSN